MVRRRKRKEAVVPEVMEELTPMEDRFVDEVVADPRSHIQPGLAAQNAGYQHPIQAGHQLMKKPKVLNALDAKRAALKERLNITQEKVMAEYAKLALSNVKDYVDEEGREIPLHELDDIQTAAITKFKKRSYFKGRGNSGSEDDRTEITEWEYILHDKKTALDSLSKIYNMGALDNPLTIDVLLATLFKQLGGSEAGELRERLVVLISERRTAA